ncbi:MAG: haloalkane dehalogenase [Henriciella sp.]|uniref:haloalkane dehalogenase n=1 Tax=Henriciella sp. TaxID=1968823 RepID=UPI003C74C464
MAVEFSRTPDDRFADLPGFSYSPHYIDNLQGYEGLRVHYLDEGPKTADRTFLCLHGQPTWSYLYRKMIPVFLESGARVIAPDWLGFGRSDKPKDEAAYTYNFHREMMINLIIRLDLKNITLVCQDWGGLLGLPIVPDMPERFSRLIVMNTAIATGTSPGEGFDNWKTFNRSQPDLPIAALMQRSTPGLSDEEAAAYAAPFPDATYKAGVRRFPELVMVSPEMEGVDVSKRAVRFWSERWEGESFMAIGLQDPVLGPPVMQELQKTIRNCPKPMDIPEGGHFVQEQGEEIARAALKHWGDLA